MMKALKTLLFILICTTSYVGCSENQHIGNNNEQGDDLRTSDVSITLSDFVLLAGCDWRDLQLDSVYLFNSQQQIAPYITGTANIDFEKQSLLVVHGMATNGILNMEKHLEKISDDVYQLHLDITLNKITEAPLWTVSVLVPKISDEARIELLVNISGKETISLAGTKWKLLGFVNGADGTTIKPGTFSSGKPDRAYWIQFKEDKTVYGHSSSNLLLGNYDENLDTSEILIKVQAATEVMEKSDGITFIDRLNLVRLFEYRESALLLYYNETDYLLFEIYNDEKE
jgi:hypothetical protein